MNIYTFSNRNRSQMVERLKQETNDVFIIGGGINGAVCAASLSAAGLKVGLADKGDFGSFTSQSSSNLVWGGIKYMENLEFGLVNALCDSRNRLMKIFPENVKEIRFLCFHQKKFRFPLLFLYAGAWVYAALGKFFTKAPKYYSGSALKKEVPRFNAQIIDGAFEYSDAYLPENDSRFTLSFMKKAFEKGANCLNYLRFKSATFEEGSWRIVFQDVSGEEIETRARVLLNAAGPFADEVNKTLDVQTEHAHAFSKGIHLILPKLTDSKKTLAFFANDGRLFFVIPMGARSCVGTTDTRVNSPISEVTDEDRRFVLDNINNILKFDTPLQTKDIIAERCGVRPLAVSRKHGGKDENWFQLSRKHCVEVNKEQNAISIFGGKLTDCLNIGEEILEIFKQDFGYKFNSVDLDQLGESSTLKKSNFFRELVDLLPSQKTNEKKEEISQRLWRRYSEHAEVILALVKKDLDWLERIHPQIELYKIEAFLSYEHEMAREPEDLLRRRSLVSLTTDKETLAECDISDLMKTLEAKAQGLNE